MKKICYLSLLIAILTIISAQPAYAKRLLPFLRTGVTSGNTATTTGSVSVSVKFRPDRLGIIVNLSNITAARKIDYFLSYATRGTTQGASGSLTSASGESISREIIFGSCSHGVCRYDSGITNAKFVVNIYLGSGQKIVKSYKLKV